MDSSLPIAKRTRLREAQMFKQYYENRKKKKEEEAKTKAESSDLGGTLGLDCRVGTESAVGRNACGEKEGEQRGGEVAENVRAIHLGDSSDEDDDLVITGEGEAEENERSPLFICIDDDVERSDIGGNKIGDDLDGEKMVIQVAEVTPKKLNSGFDSDGGNIEGGDVVKMKNESDFDDSEKSEDSNGSDDSDDVSLEELEMTSSEEESDDSEDNDYVVELDESSDEEEGDDMGEIDYREKGEKIKLGVKRKNGDGPDILVDSEKEEDTDFNNFNDHSNNDGVKRKKGYGQDILVDSDKDKETDGENVGHGLNCVAKRTRSSYKSHSGKKDVKLGTDSPALSVDEGALGSSTAHNADASVDEDEVSCIGRKTESKNDGGDCDKNGGDWGKAFKGKRIRAPKEHDVAKILVDSILDKAEVPCEEINSLLNETTLPLKFDFGIEKLDSPEKSEFDEQLDKLWDEMDFSLRSSEIHSADIELVENECTGSAELGLGRDSLCRQGNHELILDEEIGLKCRFCSAVLVEIKYIVPPFSTNPFGKSDRRDSAREDLCIFDELHNQGPDCEACSGFKPTSNAKDTVWGIIPGIKDSLFQHQCEGFEFLWNNIAGGIYLKMLKEPMAWDRGGGCVISHAPGTGKSRLTIVFLQTYMKLYPTCRPVIVAPRSMLLTWEQEFCKWKVDIPFHNLNNIEFSGKENLVALNFLRQACKKAATKRSVRLVKLFSWKRDPSILGISYTLFLKLAGVDKNSRVQDDQIRKVLLELPGLLVLDEGHTPRNDQSFIWKALSKIKTQRRIILSGTPFQNNFDELYNTLCLVRPKFADMSSSKCHGTFEKKRGRKRNKARGNWASLTDPIGKITDDKLKAERLKEVRRMIEPFVHIHEGAVLQEHLHGLKDSVVVLRPADLQKSLLDGVQCKNQLDKEYLVSLVSVHPSLILERSYEKVEVSVDRAKLKRLGSNPDAGVKTKFLMEFIRLSDALKEKVLVFSQFIDPLTFICKQLKSCFGWAEGKEVLYMHGKVDIKQRQSWINNFNNPSSEAKVLLASTRACCEGISLVGASRVVLLDVVWNPSVERQAISRAYRLEQKKVVYIYHLITSGTLEAEKYCRQIEKDRLSELVFSSSDGAVNHQKITSRVSEDKILEEMVQHDKLKHMFEKIISQPKKANVTKFFGLVDLQ